MSKFTEVLKNRNFFFLWLGQIISQLGDRLGFMALIGFAYAKKEQGSAAELFKILVFTIIPVFLIGPIAGAYVDRWDRRRTMYAADFLRAVLVAAVPFFLIYVKNPPAAYLAIFLIFCLARFFLPAKMAIIPDLVEGKDLLIANSLVNATGMIAFIIGCGLGGILVEWLGAEKSFYLDGLSFLISGTLILFITKKSNKPLNLIKFGGAIVEVLRKSLVQEIKEGLRYFISQKNIRFSAIVLFVLASALGAVSMVSIVFIQNSLHSATKGLGLLIMFLGLGLFSGTLLYGRFGQRFSDYKAISASLIFTGIMLVAFAGGLEHYPNLWAAAGLSLSLGFFVSPIMIVANTIVHKSSENRMRGKIFSFLETVMHLGFLLFMYISSILAERFPQAQIIIVIGVVFCVLGGLSFIYHRRIPWLD